MNIYLKGLSALSLLVLTSTASAALITGSLGMTGEGHAVTQVENDDGYETVGNFNDATGLLFSSKEVRSGATGAFEGIDDEQEVGFQDLFFFEPTLDPTPTLVWTVTNNGVQFSFNLDQVTRDESASTGSRLILDGSGYVTADSEIYEPTRFNWEFSANSVSGQFDFNFSSVSNKVPEPSVLALIGVGLLGLGVAGIRRKQGV